MDHVKFWVLVFKRYLKFSWIMLLTWKIYPSICQSLSLLINASMKYVMLIKLAGSSSAMHFFNVNLSKYILKKELTKLNTIIYKILIITSSKSLIVLLILYFFFFFFCNYRWHKWCGHHRGCFCCNHSSHLDGLVYFLTPPFLSFLSALKP